MKKAVIGFSGGLDSTTLLGMFLEQGFEVHCCYFRYGSKHEAYERYAVENILEYYKGCGFDSKVKLHTFDLWNVFLKFKSNLLYSGGEIPEGDYKDDAMKQTIVPGRNMIMTSIMAGIAESINAEVVVLGVHKGDSYVYPDCRPLFIRQLNFVVNLSTEDKVVVEAPFLNNVKSEILTIGYGFDVPVPYHLTRTCYKDQPTACGHCGACIERLEAFSVINKKDPILYEKQQ